MSTNHSAGVAPQLALLSYKEKQFYATYTPAPQEPRSAATELIQGIYSHYPNHAQELLRQRIYLNYPPTLLCTTMIQVAAKRYCILPDFPVKEFAHKLKFTPAACRIEDPPKENFTAALQWLESNPSRLPETPSPLYLQNRKVRAFLTDKEKTFFLFSKNENKINKTLHAEVLLLQHYFELHQKGFSTPIELYTSLQCCQMCAAMLWQMQTQPFENLKVYFLNPEKGKSARNSIFAPGSNSRRAYLNDFFKDRNFEIPSTMAKPLVALPKNTSRDPEPLSKGRVARASLASELLYKEIEEQFILGQGKLKN